MNDLKSQQSEWRKLTGESMPLVIFNMGTEAIERRLELLRNRGKNDLFCVPSGVVPMAEEPGESMMDWDNHDNKLGS